MYMVHLKNKALRFGYGMVASNMENDDKYTLLEIPAKKINKRNEVLRKSVKRHRELLPQTHVCHLSVTA